MQKASQYKIEEGSGGIFRGKIWKNLSIFHGKLLKYKGVRQCSPLGRSVYFSMMVIPTLRHSVPPALPGIGRYSGQSEVELRGKIRLMRHQLECISIQTYLFLPPKRPNNKTFTTSIYHLIQTINFYGDYINIGPAVMSRHD